MRRNEEEQGMILLQWGKAVLMGGIAACLVCGLFLLLASFGISSGFLKAGQGYQITLVACVFGSFCGGLFAIGHCPGRRLFVGIAVGGVLFLALLTCGVLLYENFSLENGGIGILGGTLCGGAAAGILAGGGKRRIPSGKKKRGR